MGRILMYVSALCVLSSCNKCEFHYFDSSHAVDKYVEWSSFVARRGVINEGKDDGVSEYRLGIDLYFQEDAYCCSSELQNALNCESENDLDEFDRLAEKNGDCGYSWRPSYKPGYGYNMALADGISDITVVSDADYDELHPVGASLADIVEVRYWSFARFLEDGDRSASPSSCSKPERLILADMAGADMSVLDWWVYGYRSSIGLYFTGEPTLSREHRFTVTVTGDSGNVCSDEVSIDFDDTEGY